MKGLPHSIAGVAIMLGASCSGGASGPAPTPASTQAPGPSATPVPARSLPTLKLALVATYGPLWYCDPDFYPVARADEQAIALTRWPEVTADTTTFNAIVSASHLDPAGPFTDVQKLVVYRIWKEVQAIALDPTGNGGYRFDYLAQPKAGASDGTRTGGTITASGTIHEDTQVAATQPVCPICLARGTKIETPSGGTAVEDLRIGDPVWTFDAAGRRIAGTVLAIGSTVAPLNHHVVHLVLANGDSVTASPGHPLADGRLIGDLRIGDLVAGSWVVVVDALPYAGGETFDIIASGPTGSYLVDGIALGSTLRP